MSRLLLSLDLDALFQEREKDQTLSAEELAEFLKKNSSGDKEGSALKHAGGDKGTGLVENLQTVHLSEEQKHSFMQAVDDGATDEELMKLLRDDGTL